MSLRNKKTEETPDIDRIQPVEENNRTCDAIPVNHDRHFQTTLLDFASQENQGTEGKEANVQPPSEAERDTAAIPLRSREVELDVEYDLFQRPPSSVHPRRLLAVPWQKDGSVTSIPRPRGMHQPQRK